MENLLNDYNVVSPIIFGFLIIPMLFGLIVQIKKARIWSSLLSIFHLLEFALSAYLSFHLTRYLFINNNFPQLEKLKTLTNLLDNTLNSEVKIYIIFSPIIFLFLILILKILFYRIENIYLSNLSDYFLVKLKALWKPFNYLLGLVLSIPQSVLNVFMACLFLNVLSIYFPSPILSDQLEQSNIYNFVNKQTIEPMLSSQYIQKIPVLFNRSLAEADIQNLDISKNSSSLPTKTNSGIRVVWYFNGVTLEDAIKSNSEIDSFAKNQVDSLKTSRRKAKSLYLWVGSNIKYDYEKADLISKRTNVSSSGAINAFSERKGICFDMSSLYVAMCRAVGLKVRLIVGTAFNGLSWGEHSWNQVFLSEEDKWVNVDTTFSIGGNYFDRKDFDQDHRTAKIAGEW